MITDYFTAKQDYIFFLKKFYVKLLNFGNLLSKDGLSESIRDLKPEVEAYLLKKLFMNLIFSFQIRNWNQYLLLKEINSLQNYY